MSKKNGLALAIIPLGIFVLQFFFMHDRFSFFCTWPDPPYAYLFNGLNLASGHLILGHVDHPGTTLQVFVAFCIRIIHLFRDGDLVEDVLANPEVYLQYTTYILAFVICSIIYFLGAFIFRKREKIELALLFQCTPFLTNLIVGSMIPMTEPFLFIAGLFMNMLLFYLLFGDGKSSLRGPQGTFLFALICAFSIVTKISSVAILIIPLVMLSSFKKWVQFSFFLILCICLFAFPMFSKLGYFSEWIINLLTHSGNYGTGKSEIIEIDSFWHNFKFILRANTFFTFSYLLVFVMSILCYWKVLKADLLQKRLFLALFLLYTFQLIIVSKHFAYQYMLPAHFYMILSYYTAFRVLKENQRFPVWKIPSFASRMRYSKQIIFAIFIGLFFYRAIAQYGFHDQLNNPQKLSTFYIEQNKDKPRIIISDLNSSYVQTSLHFGLTFSGNLRGTYAEILNAIYPNTYFWHLSENRMFDWSGDVLLYDILSKYDSFLVYLKSDEEKYTHNELMDMLTKNTNLSMREIFVNEHTHEKIYEFTVIKKQKFLYQEAYLDFENEHIKGNLLDIQAEPYQSNNEKSLSGLYSIKLDKDHIYALNLKFKLKKNALYDISCWVHSPDKSGFIVVDGKGFYFAGANIIGQEKNGWHKQALKFKVADHFADSTANIYLWSNNNQTMYIDDIYIREYRASDSVMQEPNTIKEKQFFTSFETSDVKNELVNLKYEAKEVNQEKALTGQFSTKISAQNIYGLNMDLHPKKGASYQLSCWMLSPDKSGALVVSTPGNTFYATTSFTGKKNGAWEQALLKFTTPENLADSLFRIYLWSNNNKTIYVDDVKVVEFIE